MGVDGLDRALALLFLSTLMACGGGHETSQSALALDFRPAYALGTGPTVAYDVAHHNVDDPETAAAIADRLREDGYLVRALEGAVTERSLKGVQILVAKNPLAPENREQWALPVRTAFTDEEIETLLRWIRAGGALVVVMDHMPMPGAVEQLTSALGVEVSNGFAVDSGALTGYEHETVAVAGRLEFRRRDGSLVDHPITNGRTAGERLDSVVTASGSAFRLPEGTSSLLTFGSPGVSLLPEVSWEFGSETPRRSVAGWSQAGVLRVGSGRVALLGDAMLLTAPELEPDVQNPQFTLNVFHWLSGLLPDG